MKLTRLEVLRRAVADAARSASSANTATWRARRKLDAALDVAKEVHERSSQSATVRAFVLAEATRLQQAAHEHELRGYTLLRETADLAELMGAKVEGA